MPNIFSSFRGTSSRLRSQSSNDSYYAPPPAWIPAPELSHQSGLFNESSSADYERAEAFCQQNLVYEARFIPSNAVDRINKEGAGAWGIQQPNSSSRFVGQISNVQYQAKKGQAVISIRTNPGCRETFLHSNLPIAAGLYDVRGKKGVYYEVEIEKMEGIVAIGTACLPYPEWRYPGWNRLSAGLHLDDLRKFFEDPDGGRDYSNGISKISDHDVVGCGYEFSSGAIFFTYNGVRLEDAFTGIYHPRSKYDVFAAIGVEGHCEFNVNFGNDFFKWTEGNEWQWKVDGIAARLYDNAYNDCGELPAYSPRRIG